jgi:hypothetical protein
MTWHSPSALKRIQKVRGRQPMGAKILEKFRPGATKSFREHAIIPSCVTETQMRLGHRKPAPTITTAIEILHSRKLLGEVFELAGQNKLARLDPEKDFSNTYMKKTIVGLKRVFGTMDAVQKYLVLFEEVFLDALKEIKQ